VSYFSISAKIAYHNNAKMSTINTANSAIVGVMRLIGPGTALRKVIRSGPAGQPAEVQGGGLDGASRREQSDGWEPQRRSDGRLSVCPAVGRS
jgi:hypothetical protein